MLIMCISILTDRTMNLSFDALSDCFVWCINLTYLSIEQFLQYIFFASSM